MGIHVEIQLKRYIFIPVKSVIWFCYTFSYMTVDENVLQSVFFLDWQLVLERGLTLYQAQRLHSLCAELICELDGIDGEK